MAKRSKSQRLSSLLNVAGFIVDGYNGYKYHAKNKKLVYLSLGLSTVGTVLDFYISIKSPRKFKKAVAVVTLITNGARLFTSIRKVKHEYQSFFIYKNSYYNNHDFDSPAIKFRIQSNFSACEM